jgi:hypothetical protein
MGFDDYWYVYRDFSGNYKTATNPIFIAGHKNCYAVKKENVKDIKKYIYNLNNK